MKKLAILLVLVLCTTMLVGAQTFEKKPVDPNLRYGKLANGMTYYIRHNVYPENRADFYIAQRVGSMQEEDSQRGLAHFLEHMAFNGTENFPGRKTMLDYLETVGAKFGANVNAYTAFDETVYNLSNIPVTREGIIDTCLLILNDWSGYLELKDEEIDKERLIIKEEWRTRNNSYIRTFEQQLPTLYKHSKYAYRSPIGIMEVVEHFDYQELKDYYHKWYRPDLQAIIIVGDIDADAVEAKVKTLFSKIHMPDNAAERIYHPVPDNKKPLISVVTDKENTSSRVTMYIKQDVYTDEVRKSTESNYNDYLRDLISIMLSSRLGEITNKGNAPFAAAGSYIDAYFVSKSKDAWTSVAISKEEREKESLEVLVRENERVKRFGFTETELDRAKINMLNSTENSHNNRNTRQNDYYVQEYVSVFSDDDVPMSTEFYFENMKQVMPTITLDIVNEYAKSLITDENVVVAITGPEKEGLVYPTESELLTVLSAVKHEKIEPYVDTVSDEPLVSDLPKAGTIVKTEKNEALGTTLWTLSNGMRVAFKKTDFKEDEISMSSFGYGGSSNFDVSEMHAVSMAPILPGTSGIGNFNITDLKKALAGKTAYVSTGVNKWGQTMDGGSNKESLETMLQLAYLYFTAPRIDTEAFATRMEYMKSEIRNSKKNPRQALQDSVDVATYMNNPWIKSMEEADIDKIDINRVLEIYKELFANPGNFIFSFVGTVEEEALKPLVEQYLASLPSGNKDAKYTPIDLTTRKGQYKNSFVQQMENPNATNFNLYTGVLDFNMKNKTYIDALKQVLDIVYTRTVREQEGGTYGVGVGAYISRIPEGDTRLMMVYDTDPEKTEAINPIIDRELQKIAENGPDEVDFQKVKEYMLKKHKEDLQRNFYWSDVVSTYYTYGEDIHSDKLSILEKLTKDDVKNLAKSLLSQGNLIKVMMQPKSE